MSVILFERANWWAVITTFKIITLSGRNQSELYIDMWLAIRLLRHSDTAVFIYQFTNFRFANINTRRRIFSVFLSSGRCWQRCVLSAVNLPGRMGTHRFHAFVNIYSFRFCPLLSELLGTGMDTTVVCLRWRSFCLFSAWRDKNVLALYGREQ